MAKGHNGLFVMRIRRKPDDVASFCGVTRRGGSERPVTACEPGAIERSSWDPVRVDRNSRVVHWDC
jgi:hypothetical protein